MNSPAIALVQARRACGFPIPYPLCFLLFPIFSFLYPLSSILFPILSIRLKFLKNRRTTRTGLKSAQAKKAGCCVSFSLCS